MPINDWSFLFVISTILLTPGPTNTLLASAGISAGLRRSVSLLPFECLGYLCATSLWGLVLNTVVDDYPIVINGIKIISGLYTAPDAVDSIGTWSGCCYKYLFQFDTKWSTNGRYPPKSRRHP